MDFVHNFLIEVDNLFEISRFLQEFAMFNPMPPVYIYFALLDLLFEIFAQILNFVLELIDF